MADLETQITRIDSPQDPRVSDYVNLSDRVGIKQFARFIAEGDLVVRHLIESVYTVRSVFIAENWMPRAGGVLRGLPPQVPAYVAPERVLNEVVGFGFHRGMLACGETGVLPTVADVVGCAGTLVILEALSNHDNVGAIFRIVSALGGPNPAVIVSADSCHPMYRKSIRVSMGHVLRVPFAISADLVRDLGLIHAAGFTSIALTPDAAAESLSAGLLPPAAKPALLLGAEGPGLSQALLNHAQLRVRIPMAAHVDSLNVSVAAGIALHVFAH